jgi:trk system potassium uptake protein TrkH
VASARDDASSLLKVIATALFGAALFTTIDVALALRPWVAAAMTALGLVTLPVWLRGALLLLRMEAEDRALSKVRLGRAAPYAVLSVIGLLLCSSMAAKAWIVWLSWGSEQPARFAVSYRVFAVSSYGLAALGLLGRPRRLARFFAQVAEHHARLMVGSFGAIALLGAFLLSLPVSLRDVSQASFVDALFTSVSALCVTGLAVNTVSQTYTFFGQAVILALIQVGGLGIMVLYSFFGVLAGRRMRVHHTAVMAEMLDLHSLESLRRALAGIIGFTLFIEALGAVALYYAFLRYPEIALGPEHPGSLAGAGSTLWAALFHSVSAFCNAGFSLFPLGLVPFVSSPVVCGVIAALVFIGGLGFPVWFELGRAAWLRARGRRVPRPSLHTRTVLITSGLLIALGGFGTALLEGHNALGQLDAGSRLLASFFHSVVTRTAGFNTFDMGALGAASLLLTCFLMFVGGSPGSTAGGIKTTTFAVLFATFRGELRNEQRIHLGGRSLSASTTRRALGVAFISVTLLFVLLFLLLLFERHPPHDLAFEVVSALATVGLSTGITPELTVPGKLVVIIAMFVGRIGPLTLALLLERRSRAGHIEYPEERVGIG